jgi:hypothetical protein
MAAAPKAAIQSLPLARNKQRQPKISHGCRNLFRQFVVVVKAGDWPACTSSKEKNMPQFLVAIQHPDNYDPSQEGEAMVREIGALNQEMDAAGARFFAGGLEAPPLAKSLRKQPDGSISITDGPYLEAKEYIGGFWILECADMDEALTWARKAVIACRVPVEVRAFHKIRPNQKSLS